MKKIKTIIIISIIILCIVFVSYYFHEAYVFTKGIKYETKKRDDFLKIKGIRPDSMGIIKYEDYKKFFDSIDKKNNR